MLDGMEFRASKGLELSLFMLVAIAGGWILWLGSSLLIPLLLAVFVWHLVDALARGIQSLLPLSGRMAFSLPSTALHFVLLALLFAGFFVVAGGFLDTMELVRAQLPVYVENISGLLLEALASSGLQHYIPDMDKVTGSINFAAVTGTLLGTTTSAIGNSMAVLLYVIFLILEQHSFASKLRALCGNEERSNMMAGMLQHIGSSIRTYVWLKSALALATGLASYLVLLFIGIDFAVFWGVMIFALTYVPYIGALLSVILPGLLALAQFGQWGDVVQAVVALTVVQVVIGHVIEPKLFGRSLNISPLVVLFSLAFWGALWGGMGMLMSVPIMVVVMIVCAHIPQLRSVAVMLSADGSLPVQQRQ
ncbi:MAG: AI-2E family transporter [Candidatus Porifericomitaceae bacterium WSBS_2022_MAG_OTU9]